MRRSGGCSRFSAARGCLSLSRDSPSDDCDGRTDDEGSQRCPTSRLVQTEAFVRVAVPNYRRMPRRGSAPSVCSQEPWRVEGTWNATGTRLRSQAQVRTCWQER